MRNGGGGRVDDTRADAVVNNVSGGSVAYW